MRSTIPGGGTRQGPAGSPVSAAAPLRSHRVSVSSRRMESDCTVGAMEVRDAAEIADLASTAAAEPLEEVVVVDLRVNSHADLRPLAGLPRIVVGITESGSAAVDVAVTTEDEARVLVAAAQANPIAATALVLHLRHVGAQSITGGLVAESATYSMLQAGPEHARWLASRSHRARPSETEGRVRVQRNGGRVRIELARPRSRNAVDAAMQQAIVDALTAAADADEILLTGEGPVFSAGGDLDEFGTLADPASAHLLRLSRSPARALAPLADRTTVVVQGACHGAGVELPAFAQHVVARREATFTLPEIGMGLIPGAGGTVSIPRRIGRQRTAWLAITGHPLDVDTARTWGLVDDIVDP